MKLLLVEDNAAMQTTLQRSFERLGWQVVVCGDDVVKVAVGSPDHTTLVKAVQVAEYVDVLSNAGPFTVFAPTNAAFDKLPAGTVDNLLKPANKSQLVDVLQNHVTTSALSVDDFTAGDTVAMAGGGKEVVRKEGGTMYVGGAKVIASVRDQVGRDFVVGLHMHGDIVCTSFDEAGKKMVGAGDHQVDVEKLVGGFPYRLHIGRAEG